MTSATPPDLSFANRQVVARLRALPIDTVWWSSPSTQRGSRYAVRSTLLQRLRAERACTAFAAKLMRECALQRQQPASETHDTAAYEAGTTLSRSCTAISTNATLRSAFQFVATHMRQDPAHDLMHVLRVATTTRQLGHELGISETNCILAALLHDVVNLKKGSAKAAQASFDSAQVAKRFLTDQGISDADADDICTAITTHSYSSGLRPASPLGACLQDADRLDALGAIGVLRVLHVGQRLGATLFDPKDPWVTRRPIDEKRYIVDHVVGKLRDLPKALTLDTAKRIGTERQAFLMTFFKQLVFQSS